MTATPSSLPRHHLLTVWSPVVGPNAMEQHLRVLQDAAREHASGRASSEDVYVWWGKIRSENRQAPLPHLEEILAIETEPTRDDPGQETHLYLTDYASLYVAHLGEIRRDPPGRKDRRVPPMYWEISRRRGKRADPELCDCWFRLWDIRRLVEDDTAAVAHELRKLHNVRYVNRPVSLYGGMVDLPLIVTTDDLTRYFDPGVRQAATGGQLWVEFDAEHSGTGEIERQLRENLFGEYVWRQLDPTTRTFVASGERMFRNNVRDQMFDLGLALLELAKALEVRCNALVRQAMRTAPPALRCVNRNGASHDVLNAHLTLGELRRLLEDAPVADFIRRRLVRAEVLVGEVPSVIDTIVELRNKVAHKELVDREEVIRWRNCLCGVGCDGLLVRLAFVKPVD